MYGARDAGERRRYDEHVMLDDVNHLQGHARAVEPSTAPPRPSTYLGLHCVAGCYAWMFGLDVLTMDQVADRILYGHEDDDSLRAITQ